MTGRALSEMTSDELAGLSMDELRAGIDRGLRAVIATDRRILGWSVSEIRAAYPGASDEVARGALLDARRTQSARADEAWGAAGAVDVRDWIAARREARA